MPKEMTLPSPFDTAPTTIELKEYPIMAQTIKAHQYKDFTILQSQADIELNGQAIPKGYAFATQILQAASAETGKKKRWSDYWKTESTQEYLQALSEDLNQPIVRKKSELSYEISDLDLRSEVLLPLVIVIKGGNPQDQGVWIHPRVLPHFQQWVFQVKTSKKKTEHNVRDALAAKLGGQVEVITPVGSIDILTSGELIEVKHLPCWKFALGQVIAYSYFYRNHKRRIHLFGTGHIESLKHIDNICSKCDVIFTWE